MTIETASTNEFSRLNGIRRAMGAEYPKELENIASSVDIKCYPYNPQPENVFDELVEVIKDSDNIVLSHPKEELSIKKRECLYYYAVFSDHHVENLGKSLILGNRASDIVNEIENKVIQSQRSLTVAEQLRCAIDLCDGDVTQAVTSLALASRHMARSYDNRLLPDIQVDEERMLNWKKCVAPFDCSFGYKEEDDSAGDTYHFWHNVMAGMSVQEGLQSGIVEKSKSTTGRFLYWLAAPATEIWRHKFQKRKGRLHKTIDTLGFNTGRGLYIALNDGLQTISSEK
jgi:hypothetical protein